MLSPKKDLLNKFFFFIFMKAFVSFFSCIIQRSERLYSN